MSAEPYYEDEYVTLYQGDCREITEWLDADVLVTDPPYGIAWRRGSNAARWSLPHKGIANDEDTSARDDVLALWMPRPAAVFGSWYAPFPSPLVQVLPWRKPHGSGVVGSTTGFRRDTEPVFLVGSWPRRPAAWSSLLLSEGNVAQPETRGHPHAKPGDVMAPLIDRCPDGVIADPFAGSGSTLIAAKRLGRKAIGVELDEDYCRIAAARLGSAEHSVQHDGSLWSVPS